MASNIQPRNLKGYDHEFVETPPDVLHCLVCLSVARDPQQVNYCGKVMCNTCLEDHKRYSSNCPHCRKKLTSFADKRSEQDIMSLKVRCDNAINGCKWTGELCSVEKHLTKCGFTLLPCPNECKDGDESLKLLRKDIEAHKKIVCPRRQYECLHCQESGEYQERTTTHLEECPRVRIPCPNDGCEEEIERCDVPQHRQTCLYEMISCKYLNIGCKEKCIRKTLKEHQNDSQEHLQLAIAKVHEQEKIIKVLEEKSAKHQSTPMIFRITNFNDLITFDEIFYSPSFYTSSGGYKLFVFVDTNGQGNGEGTHISGFASLMHGENDDHLPWPFTGTVTIELLNQLEDDNHISVEAKFPADDEASERVTNKERSSNGYGYPCYIPHSELGYNEAKNCQYLKEDSLYFRVNAKAESTF